MEATGLSLVTVVLFLPLVGLAIFVLRRPFTLICFDPDYALVRGVSIWVLMAVGVLLVVTMLFNMNLMYGTPVYPLTRIVNHGLDSVRGLLLAGGLYVLAPVSASFFEAGSVARSVLVRRIRSATAACFTDSRWFSS